MYKYRVMAQMETGEECCMADDLTSVQADTWIEDNVEQYVEMKLWIECYMSPCGWTEIEGD